jgi:hypothetical protein
MNTPKKTRNYQRYKNVGGKSTVVRFELEKDAVNLRFTNASAYRYTNQSAGPENISKMKTLALAGKGLGTFVEANLKDRFERKIR